MHFLFIYKDQEQKFCLISIAVDNIWSYIIVLVLGLYPDKEC